jgi:hypothetical protein
MKMLAWAGLVLSAFLVFGAAPAQAATVPLPNCMNYPSVYTPCQGVVMVDPTTGNPLSSSASPATSTPVTGSTTSSTTLGPFTPQLGRDLGVIITCTGTCTGQLLSSADGGVTKLPLTIGGAVWASYTGAVNEDAWTPTITGQTFYLALTATGGTTTGTMTQ